jgi:hypothetical protein
MQPRITDISSPSNPVLKALKALSDKRGRREAGVGSQEHVEVTAAAVGEAQVFVLACLEGDARDQDRLVREDGRVAPVVADVSWTEGDVRVTTCGNTTIRLACTPGQHQHADGPDDCTSNERLYH